MNKRILSLALLPALCITVATAQATMEQCVALAMENYPLIQKYELLERTRQTDLSDINKSWLPQISIYGQGTAQNAVPSFPDALSEMLDRTGNDMKGLGKLQYKAGIDLSQTIWDGGAAKSRREIARQDNAEQRAALDVQLYAIRERVENIFFSILLIEEQIKQTQQTQALLESNLGKLRAMKANGTAMQSDVDMVEAQSLTVGQQIIQAGSSAQNYRRLLGLYTGTDMSEEELVKPTPAMPESMTSERPELSLFDARIRANDARLGSIRASLMPKINFFAQAYYGYPGFDYFKSMMNRDMSFNALAGVKVVWSISPYYTKKNSEHKLRLANAGIAADRDTFTFDNSLRIQTQDSHIDELRKVIAKDARIASLRANVRRAAESQLENGVIDTDALLVKITDENNARLAASYHEIQLIQSICQLKYLLNR